MGFFPFPHIGGVFKKMIVGDCWNLRILFWIGIKEFFFVVVIYFLWCIVYGIIEEINERKMQKGFPPFICLLLEYFRRKDK